MSDNNNYRTLGRLVTYSEEIRSYTTKITVSHIPFNVIFTVMGLTIISSRGLNDR
jgi:hypothetical protein